MSGKKAKCRCGCLMESNSVECWNCFSSRRRNLLTASQWKSFRSVVSYKQAWARVKKGWSPKDACQTPNGKKNPAITIHHACVTCGRKDKRIRDGLCVRCYNKRWRSLRNQGMTKVRRKCLCCMDRPAETKADLCLRCFRRWKRHGSPFVVKRRTNVLKQMWESSGRIVSYSTAHARVRNGWPIELACSTPIIPNSLPLGSVTVRCSHRNRVYPFIKTANGWVSATRHISKVFFGATDAVPRLLNGDVTDLRPENIFVPGVCFIPCNHCGRLKKYRILSDGRLNSDGRCVCGVHGNSRKGS
jgi:hypothetical protein